MAFFRHTPDGNQHVRFGKISRHAPSRDRVRSDQKTLRLAFVPFKVTGNIHRLSLGQATLSDVFGIHEDDPTSVIDSTIPIVQSVDGGVELVVRSNRHQNIVANLHWKTVDRVDGKRCFAGLSGKLTFVPRWIWEVETALQDPGVEPLEPWNYLFDLVSDQLVIFRP